MKIMEFYLLRNIKTGLYVYEEVNYSFHGGDVELKETNNINHLASNYRYYRSDMIEAEHRKVRFEECYDLDLEIVKFEQHITYMEV